MPRTSAHMRLPCRNVLERSTGRMRNAVRPLEEQVGRGHYSAQDKKGIEKNKMVITSKESLSSLSSPERECSHLSRFHSPEGDEWIDNSQRNGARASIEEKWWFHGPQTNRKFLVTFKIQYLKSSRKPWGSWIQKWLQAKVCHSYSGRQTMGRKTNNESEIVTDQNGFYR